MPSPRFSLPLVGLLLTLAIVFSVHGTAQAGTGISCRLEPVVGVPGADLSGRFQYRVETPSVPNAEVRSHVLVLAADGSILQELPVEDGDVVHLAIRDQVQAKSMGAAARWLVHAPGIIVRAELIEEFQRSYAYCSPYAGVRVDRPESLVFAATTQAPSAPVQLHIAVTAMDLGSLSLTLDCEDLLAAASAQLPGGPFAGSLDIEGRTVRVEDLKLDPERGLLSVAILDLPGGVHKIRVSGTPTYADSLPPGSAGWNRPLGVLEHEADIEIFRARIDGPTDGDLLPQGDVTVTGTIVHGRPLKSLRVHGRTVDLAPAVVTPETDCRGEIRTVQFSAVIPAIDMSLDFSTGDAELSAFDPGINYVSIVAADSLGNVAGDRVRFALGDVVTPVAPAPGSAAQARAAAACTPTPTLDGFVTNGVVASLSRAAVVDRVRALVLPIVADQFAAELKKLEGRSIESFVNPCPAGGDPFEPAEAATRRTAALPAGAKATSVGGLRGDNAAPWIHVGSYPLVVQRGKSFTIKATAYDVDKEDKLTLSVEALSPAPSHIFVSAPKETTTSLSEVTRTVTVATACDDPDFIKLKLTVSDGDTTVSKPLIPVIVAGLPSIPLHPKIDKANFDPDALSLDVLFPNPSTVQVPVSTGPVSLDVSGEECRVNAFGTCLWKTSFKAKISMSDITVTATIPMKDAYCGVAGVNWKAEIAGLDVKVTETKSEGVLAWISTLGLTEMLLHELGVTAWVLNQLIAPFPPEVEKVLNQVLADRLDLGTTLPGLESIRIEQTFSAGAPLAFRTEPSNVPRIVAGKSISVGLHTDFDAVAPVDPEPAWAITQSSYPTADQLGADLAIGLSDDALNQMFSALTAAGVGRESLTGFTVGDLTGDMPPQVRASLAYYGIREDTPILLTLDPAQDSGGNPIPPIFGVMDDPGTPDKVELVLRVQTLQRGILERGNAVTSDRNLCGCTDLRTSCSGKPCVVQESVLKLNLLTSLSLVPTATGVDLILYVDEIQQLQRGSGFSAAEMTDLSTEEKDIVTTSSKSPILGALKLRINQALKPFSISRETLTVGGILSPTNLRLFAATVDDAGLGRQDYFGLAADIVPTKLGRIADPERIAALVRGAGRETASEGFTEAVGTVATIVEPRRNEEPAVASRTADAGGISLLGASPERGAPGTSIRFALDRPSHVTIDVYNIRGQHVVRLADRPMSAGRQAVQFDSAGHASGTYFYRVTALGEVRNGKIVLVR